MLGRSDYLRRRIGSVVGCASDAFDVAGLCRVKALVLALLVLVCGCGTPDEDRLAEVVERLLPRIESLSGLEARQPIAVRIRSSEELQEYVERKLEEDLPPEEMEAFEAAYKQFGLLPDTLDLRGLLLELYSEQVLGYYDPDTKALYLVEGGDAALLEPVLAHELVHALQDQHADLSALVGRDRGNDQRLAAHAAIEGHAMVVMFAFMAEQRLGHQVDAGALPLLDQQLAGTLDAQYEQFPVFRDAPLVIREGLLFPYLHGTSFVQRLWIQRQAQPPPLDSLMPVSTAQVLYPGRYFFQERMDPPPIRFGENARHVPGNSDSWRVVHEDNLGAFETSILLFKHGGSDLADVVEYWAVDRYRLLNSPEKGSALVWVSLWRDAGAAEEFAGGYSRILAHRPERHGEVTRWEVAGYHAVQVVDAERGVPIHSVPVPALIVSEEEAR